MEFQENSEIALADVTPEVSEEDCCVVSVVEEKKCVVSVQGGETHSLLRGRGLLGGRCIGPTGERWPPGGHHVVGGYSPQ